MVEPATKGNQEAQDTRIIAAHKAVAKPLDFSFLKIDNIHSKCKIEVSNIG